MKRSAIILWCFLSFTAIAQAQKDGVPLASDSLKNISLAGLKFRSIGPGLTGGRIVDLAINPSNPSEYYVAAGHGSLWKTSNNGITFAPIFDKQKSFSIGCVRLDPSNPNVVWVGTGESNNQSNVIFGDGVYKSEDGGKSWKNMGLNQSEYIGGMAIDPRNSNIAYVAAYGPYRNEGGERGIYKTTDGGKTWQRSLFVSDYTGCFEVHMDPRNSSTLYAVAHQRLRKLYSTVLGGPESAIYKTTDSGASWQKIMSGLPSEDVGRIGMAVSPVNPDILYAIVQAKENGGVYKSADRGASWVKQNAYVSTYPFYFQKLFCDPKDENRVYSMDVFLQISNDGGATWKNLGEKNKHVDNHVLWIDPSNNRHLISGCDGGLYDTWDQGKNWNFKSNLSLAEVYKVSADNALPFYNVYAGTQDNCSFGGPSRTINSGGITNQDWFYTWAGDGFETQVDWKDPNILYAQSQNGDLVRYDKKSGEQLYIKPIEMADSSYRFDWDAALLISRHDNKRLYFGGNKLFRTDDQGNTWRVISFDLTRGVPQKILRMMGKSWSMDELVAKGSMAQITAIGESPLDENILYVGSGDGLIHVTADGGKTWNKSNTVPGLPEYARIHQITVSQHNRSVAYAAAHDFAEGDYKPYLFKTTDGGKTWSSINANLPKKGSTYCIAEDHVNPDLLFVGTLFGVYFSNDGGQEWIPLNNGMPAMAVMDMEIQRRENDLVVSTFGRGIYILDDYSPLRRMVKETLQKEAAVFPIKDAPMFISASPFGFSGIGFQGASFFATPNPATGAVFTYYVKSDFKSLKQKRRDAEKEKQKKGEDIEFPSYTVLRKEGEEQEPYLLFTIKDAQGLVVRKIKTAVTKGVNRLIWDFRYNVFSPISLKPFDTSVPWNEPDKGYMAVPGKYQLILSEFNEGQFTLLDSQAFNCVPLNNTSLPALDKIALDNFNKKVAEMTRAITGAEEYRSGLAEKMPYLRQAVFETAQLPDDTYKNILSIEKKLDELNRKINGDALRAKYESVAPMSLKARVETITSSLWGTTSAPTATFLRLYDVAANQLDGVIASLKAIGEEVKQVESALEKYGAPYTPGRLPEWKKN
jgi:photosystem II stability/assembly factor-like uncharacterized protein